MKNKVEKHKQAKCYLKVDANLKDVIQYILDRCTYGVIPFGSCEGGAKNCGYLAVLIRHAKTWYNLKELLFTGITIKEEHFADNSQMLCVIWSGNATEKINNNLREYLEKEKMKS